MHYDDTIFDFITSQEAQYKKPIQLNSKTWSMKDHIVRSALYRDSDIVGPRDQFTPVKNITRPILNLQYRTEDIDVKDVQIYVDDKSKYHLSFLVKKYHDDVFSQENDLDTFFDELNQSRIDFGAGLSKRLSSGREVVPLQSIAFCDQTDMLSGPIAIKHYYSPDQLLDMASRGWGDAKNGATATLQELITLSREEKQQDKDEGISETPGRYIEVYEVHGNMPKRFFNRSDESGLYETRIAIVAFYQKKGSTDRTGIILYTAIEKESPFKLIKRDPVFGRTLGFGGAEEIFEAQLWTNYDEIRKQHMKDAASKTIVLSEDPVFTQKNNVRDMDNLSVADIEKGSRVYQMDTFPRNFQLFDNDQQSWEAHAQKIGAAQDPLQGEAPTAGTPFASLQAQIQQGMGLHDYRRGKFAKHLEEIYKDDYIPQIVKKICEGATFLSELSLDDMQYVSDCLVRGQLSKADTERVLSGQLPMDDAEKAKMEEDIRAEFKRKGTKHFIEILKGEFKGVTLGVKVSIAGKSKNLGKATDAIVNLLRFAMANPQGFMAVMQIPGMAAGYNQVIEYAGLSPVDFSGVDKIAQQVQQQQAPQPQPQQPGLPANLN